MNTDVATTAGGIVVGIGRVNAGTATWTGPDRKLHGVIETGNMSAGVVAAWA